MDVRLDVLGFLPRRAAPVPRSVSAIERSCHAGPHHPILMFFPEPLIEGYRHLSGGIVVENGSLGMPIVETLLLPERSKTLLRAE